VTFANILPAHPLQGLRARIQQAKADNAEFQAKKAIYDLTFNQLSAMSNRDLADIGIRSSDIESIAAQAVNLAAKKLRAVDSGPQSAPLLFGTSRT
jgi:hypothetical protein